MRLHFGTVRVKMQSKKKSGQNRNWGSKQLITLWRDLEAESIEIKSDELLLDTYVGM